MGQWTDDYIFVMFWVLGGLSPLIIQRPQAKIKDQWDLDHKATYVSNLTLNNLCGPRSLFKKKKDPL